MLVTGPPGAGKSTLAEPLAERLALPFVGKDPIKEALFRAFGVGDVEWSKRCGRAAMEVLYVLLGELRDGVVECNFSSVEHRTRVAALVPKPLEIFCHVPESVAVLRFAERQRHEGHRDGERQDEVADWVASAEPLAIGPVLMLDTTGAPDLDAVVDWVGSQ